MVKLITWNINGIRAVAQKGLHQFWQAQLPDIFCLQETKAHPDQADFAVPKGWQGYWSAAQRPGYSGVATFSRETPLEVQYGFGIRKFDAEGRMVVARFKDFVLYNVYFPNGGSGEERHLFKQEFLRRFSDHLKKSLAAGDNVVVVGDYNVAYMDIDVFNPKALATESGFLPEERRWMEEFLSNGFVDSFRHFHPKESNRYTWWSYQQNGRAANRGWRIDHVCVSKKLVKKLKAAQILEEQEGSDHCPVIVEFSL